MTRRSPARAPRGDFAGADPALWRRHRCADARAGPRFARILFVALLSAILLSAAALSQVSPEIANEVNRAVDAFRDGDYQRALKLFQSAARRAMAYRPTVENYLVEAQLELRRGDGEGALAAIEEALALDRRAADAHALRGHVLRRMGRASEAFAALDRALEIDPAHGTAAEELWSLLEPRRDYGRAISTYRKHLERAPESLHLLFHLGKAYERVGDYERAAETFIRALEVDPRQSVIHNHLLRTLDTKEGEREAVIEVYEKLAAERPDPMLRLFLARLYIENERVGDAEALLDELAGRDVDSVDASMRLALGETYADAGLYDRAAEQARRVLQLIQDPNAPERIEVIFDLGKWLVKAGEVEQGIRQLELSMRLHERTLRRPPLATYFQLGSAYRELGDSEQAEFYFQRFNRRLEEVGDFTDTETLTSLGDIYMEDGNYRRAAEHYKRVVAYDPGRRDVQLKLARAYLALESWAEAIVEASEAADSPDVAAEAKLVLARAYVADRQPPKALAVLRELEGEGALGDEAAAVMAEALLAADEGPPEAALDYIERAYEAEPGSPERALLYAQVLASLGRFGEARGLYEQVLESHPEEVGALVGLGRLELGVAERRWPVLRRGALEAAVEHLRAARALAPTDLGVRAALADAERELAGAETLVRTLLWFAGVAALALALAAGLHWYLGTLRAERLIAEVRALESDMRELLRRSAIGRWADRWQDELTRGAWGGRIDGTRLRNKAEKQGRSDLLEVSTFGQLVGLFDVALEDPEDTLGFRRRCRPNDRQTRGLVVANLSYIGACRNAVVHLHDIEPRDAGRGPARSRGGRTTVANLMYRRARRSIRDVREQLDLSTEAPTDVASFPGGGSLKEASG